MLYIIKFIYNRHMKNQFDYDEYNMHQQTSNINMPNPTPRTPKHHTPTHPFINSHTSTKGTLPQQPRAEQHTALVNRVSLILLKKQTKIKAMKQQLINKAEKQCTFKPKTISNNKNRGEKRTLNQFLQEQTLFQRKIQNKCKNIKQNIEKKETNESFFQPTINKKSKRMQIRKEQERKAEDDEENTTVFDRLYLLRDKENQHPNITIDLFMPQINQKSKKMIRPAAIENLLYNDAKRRQQRLNTQPAVNQDMKTERSISVNNQRYVANKFIKEYCSALQRLQIDHTKNRTITYILFNEILKYLHFINAQQPSTVQDNAHQRMLVNQAYQFVAAHAANLRNICIFLLALIGIFNVDPINFQKEGKAQKQLQLNESVGRKIQAYFQCFKINRLSYDENNKKEEQQFENKRRQQFSFHPKINKMSEELAQKHRAEMLHQASILLQKYPELQKSLPKSKNGKITNSDLLVLKDMVRQLRIQKQKQEKQKLNLMECTFKPSTNHCLSSQNNQSTTCGLFGLGDKKSLQLYNEHKDRLAYRQYLHSNKRDPEEQSIRHCTFSPSINPFNLQSGEPSPHHSSAINNQHSSIRSQANHSRKRVATQPVQKQTEQTHSFDVSLKFGQYIEYIRLGVGDFETMDQVVNKLSNKYELEQQQIERLHELLRREMELGSPNQESSLLL